MKENGGERGLTVQKGEREMVWQKEIIQQRNNHLYQDFTIYAASLSTLSRSAEILKLSCIEGKRGYERHLL